MCTCRHVLTKFEVINTSKTTKQLFCFQKKNIYFPHEQKEKVIWSQQKKKNNSEITQTSTQKLHCYIYNKKNAASFLVHYILNQDKI